MLDSAEHGISTALKTKMLKIKKFSCFQTLRCIYHAKLIKCWHFNFYDCLLINAYNDDIIA